MCGGFKGNKYSLYVLNFLILCAGALLVAIGIWFVVDSAALRLFSVGAAISDAALLQAAAIIIIIIGSMTFVTAVIGSIATCMEHGYYLVIYAAILFTLLFGQVATGILAGIYRQQLVDGLQNTMITAVKTSYNENQPLRDTWDYMQIELKCCGALEPGDWKSSSWINNNNLSQGHNFPESCCTRNSRGEVMNCRNLEFNTALDGTIISTRGCYNELNAWTKRRLAVIIGVSIGLILIQLIGVIFACCFGQSIKNRNVFS